MMETWSIGLHHSNVVLNIIFISAFALNLIFAFTIIFLERRTAGAIWAWLLVLVLLPLLGFVLYLLFGRQIQRNHIFKIDEKDKIGIQMIVNEQLEALKNDNFSKGNHQIVKFKDMVQMLLYNNAAFLTTDNDVTIYTDGRKKFDALLEDIHNAKDYIHIQYYIFRHDKFGYWRDTHLRIVGDAVNALQLRYMLDWNAQATRSNLNYQDRYFPDVNYDGNIGIQIASSGPDEEWEQIKYGYLKMISSAKKSIFIQLPYFIPDQAFLDAVKIAALGGVNVNIMIPDKPDHPFVYWATYNNVASLLDAGVNIFQYRDGFLHSKCVIIDDEVASVGTTNMDHRSFTLNFEINAFIYDTAVAKQLRGEFEKDLLVSYRLTKELYEQRSIWVKFKEGIARLLSPIL